MGPPPPHGERYVVCTCVCSRERSYWITLITLTEVLHVFFLANLQLLVENEASNTPIVSLNRHLVPLQLLKSDSGDCHDIDILLLRLKSDPAVQRPLGARLLEEGTRDIISQVWCYSPLSRACQDLSLARPDTPQSRLSIGQWRENRPGITKEKTDRLTDRHCRVKSTRLRIIQASFLPHISGGRIPVEQRLRRKVSSLIITNRMMKNWNMKKVNHGMVFASLHECIGRGKRTWMITSFKWGNHRSLPKLPSILSLELFRFCF